MRAFIVYELENNIRLARVFMLFVARSMTMMIGATSNRKYALCAVSTRNSRAFASARIGLSLQSRVANASERSDHVHRLLRVLRLARARLQSERIETVAARRRARAGRWWRFCERALVHTFPHLVAALVIAVNRLKCRKCRSSHRLKTTRVVCIFLAA